MSTERPKAPLPELQRGWIVLPPAKLPDPSLWPPTLAMGIAFLVWGLITSLIITGVGLLLFAGSLTGWIKDIRHERARD